MSQTLSIFKTPAGETAFQKAYAANLRTWSTPHETFYVPTEFGATHVIASGPPEGEPIVLLHGMTGNSTLWEPTLPALSGYRTYCIDTVGDLGRSRVAKAIRTRADAAAWLDQVITGLPLTGAPTLVGHSMGGWLSLNYAVTHPERINRLVLLAPVASFARIPLLTMLPIYLAMLLPTPARVQRAWDRFLAPGNHLPPLVMEMITAAYIHCRPQLAVIPGAFPAAELARITVPVLFLVGDAETIYPAEQIVGKVRAVLPQAVTQIIPGAGHCLTAEQPRLVNEAIQTELTRVRRRTNAGPRSAG